MSPAPRRTDRTVARPAFPVFLLFALALLPLLSTCRTPLAADAPRERRIIANALPDGDTARIAFAGEANPANFVLATRSR